MVLLLGSAACFDVDIAPPKLGLRRLFRRPYRGPICIIEIIGAELTPIANSGLDWRSPFGLLSKGTPDLRVEWTHGSASGDTQVEECTYSPSWFYSRKLPYTKGEGVNFRVVDVDTFSRNEVVGRCFCPATVMQQAMESNTPIVMSLGEGVGKLKVLVHGPLTSRSGMLMNNNAGMLEEKGSRNEQALATSRTAASMPASQAEAKQAKQAKQEADAKQASEAKLAKQAKQAKQAAEAKEAAKSKK